MSTGKAITIIALVISISGCKFRGGKPGAAGGAYDAAGYAGLSDGRDVNYCRTPAVITLRPPEWNPAHSVGEIVGGKRFSNVPLGTWVETPFVVKNHGEWQANDLGPGGTYEWGKGPYATQNVDTIRYKGGRFPGTGGTCVEGQRLMEGDSCLIVVEAVPTRAGYSTRGIKVNYYNGRGLAVAEALMIFDDAYDPNPPPVAPKSVYTEPYQPGEGSCVTEVALASWNTAHIESKRLFASTGVFRQSMRFQSAWELARIDLTLKRVNALELTEGLRLRIYRSAPQEEPEATNEVLADVVLPGRYISQYWSEYPIILESPVAISPGDTYVMTLQAYGGDIDVRVNTSYSALGGYFSLSSDSGLTWFERPTWDIGGLLHRCALPETSDSSEGTP